VQGAVGKGGAPPHPGETQVPFPGTLVCQPPERWVPVTSELRESESAAMSPESPLSPKSPTMIHKALVPLRSLADWKEHASPKSGVQGPHLKRPGFITPLNRPQACWNR